MEGDSKLDTRTREILKDMGRIAEAEPQPVVDYFLNEKDDSRSVRTSVGLPGLIDPASSSFYRGFSYKLDRANPLVFPIVTASATAASTNGGLIGRDNILVSGLVARNDARSVVMGTVAPFEDGAFDRSLAHGLVSWATKRIGVHRIDSINPSILAEGVNYFRIRDKIEVEVCLSGKDSEGRWQPFLPPDAQIELVMMTPTLRANLRPSPNDPACLSTGPIQLPSRYGAYSLMFRYQRPGISHLVQKQPLTVLPYRYDMVPRFEAVLWPYYFSWISNMAMTVFVLIPALLWSLKSRQQPKAKTN